MSAEFVQTAELPWKAGLNPGVTAQYRCSLVEALDTLAASSLPVEGISNAIEGKRRFTAALAEMIERRIEEQADAK